MKKYGTLLIVDDEKDIGKILQKLFSPIFEKVIYCDNAQQAIGVSKATDLSAIITDMNMPGMSGKDLIVNLRSEGCLTPVVVMTGYLTQDIAVAALRLGVVDIIEKPFLFEDITQKIDRVLEIQKRQRQLGSQNTDVLTQQKRMVGLLQVVNEKNKKAS